MLKKFFLLLLVGLVLLSSVILFNTFTAKKWPAASAKLQLEPLSDSSIIRMSRAVQIPTISYSDTSAIDTAAFIAFNSFLETSYPLVHKQLKKTVIRNFSYIYEWKGRDTSLAPIILMGHYDVVPVEASTLDKWKHPPFGGEVADSLIWGRGSLDDKSGVISILEAVEAELKKGFVPKQTIYCIFGHDEEISGQSAAAVSDYLFQKGIKAEMVLDEGGEMTEEKTKEFGRPIAVIGVAEKGYASYELIVEKEGGHSSTPDKETAIDILAKALVKLRSEEPPTKLTPQLKEFMERIGPSSDKFVNRMATSNLWIFSSIVENVVAAEPEGNAMLHTTIVPTIISGGIKDNVVPGMAKAIVNSRILSGETAVTVEAYIKKVIADDRVQIKRIGKFDSDPSPATATNSSAFKRIEQALAQTVPQAIPTPYQMVGATDSRYYRKLSNGVVNFFPMTDAKGYHGVNERMPLIDFRRGIAFYMRVIESQ